MTTAQRILPLTVAFACLFAADGRADESKSANPGFPYLDFPRLIVSVETLAPLWGLAHPSPPPGGTPFGMYVFPSVALRAEYRLYPQLAIGVTGEYFVLRKKRENAGYQEDEGAWAQHAGGLATIEWTPSLKAGTSELLFEFEMGLGRYFETWFAGMNHSYAVNAGYRHWFDRLSVYGLFQFRLLTGGAPPPERLDDEHPLGDWFVWLFTFHVGVGFGWL